MPEVKVVITETNSELNVTETDAVIILGTSGPQGAAGLNAGDINADAPATWDEETVTLGVDQDGFDRIGNLDYAQFDITDTTGSDVVGKLAWSVDNETLEVALDDSVVLQLGQEQLIRVKNASGSVAIPEFTLVMFAGATGDTVTVAPAVTNGSVPHEYMVGITTEVIPADGFGFVTTDGFINGIDTSAYTLGAILYADPATPGGFTTTKPQAPNLKLPIAAVTRVNANSGRVLVRMTTGLNISELHDVQTNGKSNHDALVWDSVQSRWENAAIDYSWLANTPSTFTPAAHASSHGSAGSDPVTVAPSQVSGTAVVQGDLATATVGTAGYATTAGTSVYATNSGTATYATTSGTAAYSTASGTAAYATTSGTSAYATASGTAVYATTSGTAAYATLSGTAAYATAADSAITAGTATYATTSGTATYATTSGTAAYSTASGTASYATLAGQVSGTAILISEKGSANGIATLDGSGLVPTTQIPPLAITDTFVVASEAAMLALTAEIGDVAIRTDVSKTFILQASPASTLANWKELLTPADGVTSIIASAPLTGGTITSSGTIGLDQTALAITAAQVSGTAVVFSDLATATVGTAGYATTAGTASYSTTSGTAVYSTTSGTATYATNAGTSVYATNAGTAVYANNAGTATPSAHAASHGSAGSDPVTINKTQVTGTAVTLGDTGTVTNTMLQYSTISLGGSAVPLGGTAPSFVSQTNGTVTTAATTATVVRNITLSTADPTGGTDGDVWLKYTA